MAWIWLLLWAGAARAAERPLAPPRLEPLPAATAPLDGASPSAPAIESPGPLEATAAPPVETGRATSFGGPEPSAFAQARAALESAGRTAAELVGSALDDALEIDVPFLEEARHALKLDADGAIELDRQGFPERESYFAASKAAALLRDEGLSSRLGAGERAALESLRQAYERTRALLFSGGNELALTVEYAEPTPGGRRMPILDYVRSERFKTPKWWAWSSQHAREAPRGYAHVTSGTAQSPFLKELGPGAYSTIYWAAVPGEEFGSPDAEGMRVRVNSDAFGNELMLEVFAPVGREDDGSALWKGFFFKKIGDEWVPGSPQRAEPGLRCIGCHVRVDAQGRKRLTPIPTILKTKERFLAAGYEDTPLLASYLRALAAAP